MNIHIHHFHSKGAVADHAALEQFQTQWATYQKLVDADALAHKEVGAVLHGALAAIATPFAFVDIACGDAGQMKAALSGTKAKHYHGIDLSEPALELAAKNLAGVPFEVELDHRDFVTALTKRPEPADAAWCGLSIHHLSTEGKRDLLEAIRGSTSAFLMIYEPTRLDGESRDDYLARFRRVNRPAWPFLSARGVGADRSSRDHLRLSRDERDVGRARPRGGLRRCARDLLRPDGLLPHLSLRMLTAARLAAASLERLGTCIHMVKPRGLPSDCSASVRSGQ